MTKSKDRFLPAASLQAGFTLVEMLVVVVIIVMLSYAAFPTVSSFFKQSLNASVREMANAVKGAYNATVVTGKVHRLVYDLEKSQFWVEEGPQTVLLDSEESRELEKNRRRITDDDSPPPPNKFDLARTVTRNKVNLPRGVIFADIDSDQLLEPIKKGQTYTYFFPHGVMTPTVIHLLDNSENKMTLVVNSVVGKSQMLPGHVEKDVALGRKE